MHSYMCISKFQGRLYHKLADAYVPSEKRKVPVADLHHSFFNPCSKFAHSISYYSQQASPISCTASARFIFIKCGLR